MSPRITGVFTDSDPQNLQHPVLVFLKTYWDAKRAGRPMPSRADIRPADMKEHLGWIILLDALGDCSDFRYRTIGTRVTQYVLADATGKTIAEAIGPYGEEAVAETMKAFHRKAANDKQPVRAHGDADWLGRHILRFDALFLPLSDDGEQVNMILSAFTFAVSGAPTRPPPGADGSSLFRSPAGLAMMAPAEGRIPAPLAGGLSLAHPEPHHRNARRRISDRPGADGLDRARRSSRPPCRMRAAWASSRPRPGGSTRCARRSRRCATLTDKPFGVNIAQAFVRDPDIVSFVVDQGVKFVTTSAGDPNRYCSALKEAGLTVFHVVPSLEAALKAIDAGVDGLVVEGGEGGGFKNPRDVASMVLLPLVCAKVNVPVIAAGGIVDGRTMAAAFALGAEGVQMGTRMVSAAESPGARELEERDPRGEGDRHGLPQPLRTGAGAARAAHGKTTRLEKEPGPNIMGEFGNALDLYFGGDMEASIALSGQVAGRIDAVKPVAQIIRETVAEFEATLGALSKTYCE